MATRSPLLACPDDILLLILEQSEKTSVSNLSQTCEALRSRCIPQMYREVDLSSHNIGRFPEHEDDKFRPEQWTHMDDFHRPGNLLSLQRSFLRTMCECPDYAGYVRSFSWTLIWRDQHTEDGLTEIDYQLWAVFSCMDRVEKLDLAAIAVDNPSEGYRREVPPILFPQVTDLRLVGWMPHNLAVNIFNSIDLSKLYSLRLNALQEDGQDSKGSLVSEDFNKTHWDDQERAQLCESRRKGSTPANVGVIYPGPMWIPFLPLIGKLTSLQCLEITIPPFEDTKTYSAMGGCPDHTTYISVMAELIESVSPNLERLTIDYARELESHGRMFDGFLSQRLCTSELMLRSFFSSLSTNEWKWRFLRRVSLKGFLQDKELVRGPPERSGWSRGVYLGPSNMQLMTKIRNIQASIEALSSNRFTLEWSDDSPRPAFNYMGLI
jgi:hypothetical protein